MQPNCSMAVPESSTTPASRSVTIKPVTADPYRTLQPQRGLRAELKHRSVTTARLGMFRTPLLSAAALHATCLAAALVLSPEAPPPAPVVFELLVQPETATTGQSPDAAATPPEAASITPPDAAATPPEAASITPPDAAAIPPETASITPPDAAVISPEAASMTSPDAAATPPEAASITPPAKPDAPPPDEPQGLPLSRPVAVAEQPAAPAEPIITPAENPPQVAAPDSSVATLPDPPPVTPPPRAVNRQARLSAAHHAVTAQQVKISTDPPQPNGTSPASAAAQTPPNSASTAQRASLAAHAADQQSVFQARVRDAVQAAVHYPAAARMMGLTGRARVQLDYQNGVVDDPSLAQSSGTPMLDHAAITAAEAAHYPAPPPELAGRFMRFLVWVEFTSA